MRIETQIKVFMLQHSLTVRSAAERLGISRSYLHDILSGRYQAAEIRERATLELGFPRSLITLQRKRHA